MIFSLEVYEIEFQVYEELINKADLPFCAKMFLLMRHSYEDAFTDVRSNFN